MTSRNLIFAGAMMLSSRALFAAPYLYESFETSALGSPTAQTSGEGFAGAYTAEATATIKRGTLSYTNGDLAICGGTTYLELAKSSTEYVLYRLTDTTRLPSDESDIYMSFLVRVPASCADADDIDYFLFGLSSAGNKAPVLGALLTANEAKTGNGWGLRNASNNLAGEGSVVGDHTYLIVVKLAKKGGAKYYYSLAVDPSSATEPESTGWYIYEQSTGFSALSSYGYLVAYLKYNPSNSDKCEEDDVFAVDEIRFGTSWADVTGPATYNGVVPRPEITFEGADGGRTVFITNGTLDSEIYYSTDGTEPTVATGIRYNGPFSLTSSKLIKAVAVLNGVSSEVVRTACNFDALWTGGGDDSNWDTKGNWTPATAPDGMSLVFGAAGRTESGTAGHFLSRNLSVSSLTYTNNSFAPAAVPDKAYWQVTEIKEGTTLSVYAMNDDGYSIAVVPPKKSSGKCYGGAGFVGDGKLSVASPESELLVWSASGNDTGYAYLDLSGLAEFAGDVSRIRIGQGGRSSCYLRLAARGKGQNLVKADAILVGDSHGTGTNTGTSGSDACELVLGQANEIDCDEVYIAGSEPGYWNQVSGKLYFRTGLTEPTVKLRAKDGVGRMSMWVGTHGQSVSVGYKSTVSGSADFTGGSVDALLDILRVGESCGRNYDGSNKGGRVKADFAMSAGSVNANALILGRTRSGADGNGTCYLQTSTLSVSGGDFTVNGDAEVALNDAGGKQGLTGKVNLAAGTLSVGGDLTLATRLGTATNVIADVTVEGGVLTVFGDLCSGVATTNLDNAAQTVNLQANVNALGGVIAVTNAQGTAELRLEQGTLTLAGGRVYADNLTLTNAASVVTAVYGAGYQPVTVSAGGAIKLGGRLAFAFESGVKPAGENMFVIAQGAPRTGCFSAADVPDGLMVVYGPDFVAVGRLGLTIFIR